MPHSDQNHIKEDSSKPFSPFSYLFNRLSTTSRTNLYKQVKHQLIFLYAFHYILNAILFRAVASNMLTGLIFIFSAILCLQHSIKDIIGYVNGIFLLLLGILVFSNGDYGHKFVIYLPQLSLLTTNNIDFAVFLEAIVYVVSIWTHFEWITSNELYSSTILLGVLVVILNILKTTELNITHLKAKLDSLEEQLKASQNKLKESNAFIKDFHLTMSHEFRNPLSMIMGNIDLIQKNLTPNDPSYEKIKIARLGCETLLSTLNNTLDYCKAEFDEIDLNYVSLNIRKCLEKIWGTCSEYLRVRGLNGELYLHANVPPMIMIDPGRLHQILWNLIYNSSKFTPKGFVKVIISWHPCYMNSLSATSFGSTGRLPSSTATPSVTNKRTNTPEMLRQRSNERNNTFHEDEFAEYPSGTQKITFSPSMNYYKLDLQVKKFPKMHKRRLPNLMTEESIGFLKIQVIDSGVGIHYSNMSKLFQKFSKFSHDAVPRVEGSGLGLYITKKICTKMDGSIHVHSEVNKGSTFLLFLKCEVSPQSLGTPTPSPAMDGRRDRTTLQTMASMPFIGMKAKNASAKIEEKRPIEVTKLKAMVVDDIPYNQQLNKQFLELCGAEVSYVMGNGLEAYKKFTAPAREDLDLIFMDLDMPVMDGKTSSTKIREWERTNQIKPVIIVILTGNCSEDELRQCLDKNGSIKADYFYRKPLSLSDCQNLIQQIKREKNKKRNLLGNLPVVADHIIFYEKDLFQQVLLENYLRVGQIKYHIANKTTIIDKFTKYCDSICTILYNCEGSAEGLEEGKSFIQQIKEVLKRKGRKEIPILAIIKDTDKAEIPKLKQIGFRDFLVKPFDYENIVKLLNSHTVGSLPM